MASGFATVTEELVKASSAITEAVSHAAGLVWDGPSGNYGHPGVQDGWTRFIADLRTNVDTLARTADGHSETLKSNASNYTGTDSTSASTITSSGSQEGH